MTIFFIARIIFSLFLRSPKRKPDIIKKQGTAHFINGLIISLYGVRTCIKTIKTAKMYFSMFRGGNIY